MRSPRDLGRDVRYWNGRVNELKYSQLGSFAGVDLLTLRSTRAPRRPRLVKRVLVVCVSKIVEVAVMTSVVTKVV